MEFSTLQTTLPSSDLERATRAQKIATRLDDRHAHKRVSDTLASTLTVTGTN